MRLLICFALPALAACGGASSSGSATLASGNSFAADVKPILTKSGCLGHHMTSAWDGVNGFTANADIINYLTTNKAEECGGAPLLIKPGDSAGSYLYQKVAGTFDSSCTEHGARMPFGASPLPASAIATLKTWIDQGALDD
jgi:hypothetical protein